MSLLKQDFRYVEYIKAVEYFLDALEEYSSVFLLRLIMREISKKTLVGRW